MWISLTIHSSVSLFVRSAFFSECCKLYNISFFFRSVYFNPSRIKSAAHPAEFFMLFVFTFVRHTVIFISLILSDTSPALPFIFYLAFPYFFCGMIWCAMIVFCFSFAHSIKSFMKINPNTTPPPPPQFSVTKRSLLLTSINSAVHVKHFS